MRAQAFYYSRWFYCRTKGCVVTLYMRDEFKVFPDQPPSDLDRQWREKLDSDTQ